MAFGKELKRIRLASGMSGKKLADRLGINQEKLKKWELNDLDPRSEDKIIIEGEFQMKIEEIEKLSSLPESILITNLTGDIPSENKNIHEIAQTFGERYKQGKRFSKIIGEIIRSGTTLEQLRDNILKIKGVQLSKMYLGFIPVSEIVLEILEDRFAVNSKFVLENEEPMFLKKLNSNLDIKSERFLTYYTGDNQDFKEDEQLNDGRVIEEGLNLLNLFNGSQYVVKMTDDSMNPKYPLGCLIGIREVKEKNIVSGNVYVFEKEGTVFVRRLFNIKIKDEQSSNVICLSDNDTNIKKSNFLPFPIDLNKIKKLFKIISVYSEE